VSKLLLFVVLPALVLLAVAAAVLSRKEAPAWSPVATVRGTVVRYATATGRIEPRFEVPVTSRRGGVLARSFVELGQRVQLGEALVEVRPIVTDIDMLAAERAVLDALAAEEDASELRAGETLMGRAMLWFQGRDNLERMQSGVARARSDAEERLQLLRDGSARIEGKVIDFLVRSPIEGNVIELAAEVGQPVVPSSQYGVGTELLVLADLENLLFRGTVAEIDVGRLREGMRATLEVGALPEVPLEGRLVEIALRSHQVNNATMFDVELSLSPPPDLVLRSGYSAVARIEIARAADVLVLPERVVEYRGERTFVLVDDGRGQPAEREIQAGLSDGLIVEVKGGLSEGDEVLERMR